VPVEVIDEFAEEEAKRQKRQAQVDEASEFGDMLLKTAQPLFDEKLEYKVCYWFDDNTHKDEYKINVIIPRTGRHLLLSRLLHRGKVRKKLVAQVMWNREKAKHDLEISVFAPAHREVAEKIAAISPLVYGDKIKIRVVRKPVSY
jgi:hypothetical protein